MGYAIFLLFFEAMALYLLVLGAHSLRHRFGFVHFFALLGSITAVMRVYNVIWSMNIGGITFGAGSTVLFPSLLLGVFVLYLFDGPKAARDLIFALIGVSLIVAALLPLFHAHIHLIGYPDLPSFPLPTPRRILVSVVVFLIDLVFLGIAWEYLGKPDFRLTLSIRSFLTLLGVMWLDVLLFSTGTYGGTPAYLSIMKGSFLSRFIICVFAFPFLYGYLHWQSTKKGIKFENRPVLAILQKMAKMELALSNAQEEIERRKQAETSLQETASRLQALSDASFESIFFSDKGVCIDQNRTAQRVFGYSDEEAVGKHGTKWIAPEYREIVNTNMATGCEKPYEVIALRKDGTTFPAEIQGRMFAYRGKSVRVTALRDITSRKAIEEALRESERRVKERSELAEQRAEQLQRLALELSSTEEREHQRIAMILHDDLQQLLAALRFRLHTLVPKDLVNNEVTERLQKFENIIDESIRKCRNLSHDLSPPTLHQNGLLAALEVLGDEMNDKYGLEVSLQTMPEAEPRSPVLAFVLYRSVRELLFNCKKHAGVPEVCIQSERVDDHIRITVSDNGNGFDASSLQGGLDQDTGLGLFAVQERIQSLCGRVTVRTAPGEGCRISLTVPDTSETFPASTATGGTAVSADGQGGGNRANGRWVSASRRIRILLADDNELMREGLAGLFHSKPDLTVVGQAATGREAVRLARELHPDVILMDISMPDGDGIEATTEITRTDSRTRIIGLTMHDDAGTKDRMMAAGASGYIYKAAPTEELLQAVRAAWGTEGIPKEESGARLIS